MLPFIASQAIGLSQAKNPPKSSANSQQHAAPRARKGFFLRLFEAMRDARMRQAEVELRYHRSLHEESLKK